MAVRKTLTCFSRCSSSLISSVFTEQQRIWFKNYQLARKLRGNPLHQVNWMNKKFSHNLLHAEVQANEERQGNLLQEYEQLNEKLSEDQKSSRLCLRSRFEISRNWTILLFSSVTKRKRKSIFMPRIFDASRSRRNSYQNVDPKQCTISPSLGHKSLQSPSEDTVLKFRFNLSFKIKPYLGSELWTVLTNMSEKPYRSKRKRKLRRNPRCKSETDIKTVINKWLGLYSHSAETMDWHWNTGTQWSLLFSSVKIHHSITSTQSKSLSRRKWRSPLHDQVIDECKKKQSDNAGYWSDEMKKDFVNAPHWSIEKWISVLSKGGGQKRKVSIFLESEISSSILVPSSNPRTFRKYNQSCIARQCTVMRRFCRVYLSRRKRKRIEVNCESWFDSRRTQSKNRQTSCVLQCCESDG